MKIAVLEDEADIVKLYTEILTDAGHDVWLVDQHDLSTIGDAEVVVLDLMMPDVGGEEVLDWLAVHKPHVRSIVASAMYRVPDDVKAKATHLLAKPFTPKDLLEAL